MGPRIGLVTTVSTKRMSAPVGDHTPVPQLDKNTLSQFKVCLEDAHDLPIKFSFHKPTFWS